MTDTTPTPPVYEDVVMTRTLGRGVRVQTAPEHALISLSLLRDPGAYISEVSPGYLLLADQVEYQVTGYDPERAALTLRLVNDHRPTARLTFGGVVDTSFQQVGEGPVCDGLPPLPRRTRKDVRLGAWLTNPGQRDPDAIPPEATAFLAGLRDRLRTTPDNPSTSTDTADKPTTCDCSSSCGGLNACDVCPTPGPHIPGATHIRRTPAAPTEG